MLCCTGAKSNRRKAAKRPRHESQADSDDEYGAGENTYAGEETFAGEDIATIRAKLQKYDEMAAKVEQLERLLLSDKFPKSLVDLIILLDEKYAKRFDDIDASHKAALRNTADILRLVTASTKYYDTTFADLPEEIRNLCKLLQTRVAFEYKRFGIVLGVPEGVIDKIKGSNQIECYWKIIQFRQTMEPIKPQQLLDACQKVKRIDIEQAREMPKEHKEIITSFKSALYMDVIDTVVIIPYMRCFMYISPEIVQYVISPDNKIARMVNLIDIMPTLGYEALEVVTDALHHSGHESLAATIREKAMNSGHPIAPEPKQVPLDDADRILLRRKSKVERSQRVNEEVREIRDILMNKMKEQLDNPIEENTQF